MCIVLGTGNSDRRFGVVESSRISVSEISTDGMSVDESSRMSVSSVETGKGNVKAFGKFFKQCIHDR